MAVTINEAEALEALPPELLRAAIPAAIRERDWLAVEGLLMLLASRDPESAQVIYDVMVAVATAEED